MRSVAQPYWGDDMSVWVVPRTWTNTVLTAADLNGEIRDHLLWLKGFADLITASTASDTGASTRLLILRNTSTSTAYEAGLAADTVYRFRMDVSGKMTWGDGTGVGVVSLERMAANRVGVTGGAFVVERTLDTDDAIITGLVGAVARRFEVKTSGALGWGDGTGPPDTELYRTAANRVGMPAGDSFHILDGLLYFGGTAATPSASIYELVPGRLYTPQTLRVNDGITTMVKPGVISDGDFTLQPASGTMAVDTANNRLYVRSGGTWRYTALT